MLKPVRMAKIDCVVYAGVKDAVVSALHKNGVAQVDYVSDDALTENNLSRGMPAERVTEVSNRLFLVSKLTDTLKPYFKKNAGFVEDMLGVDTQERVTVKDLSFEKLMQEVDDFATNVDYRVRELSSQSSDSESALRDAQSEIKELKTYEPLDFDLSILAESPILESVAGLIPKTILDSLEGELDEKLGGEYYIEFGRIAGASVPLVASTTKKHYETLLSILKKKGFMQARLSGDASVCARLRQLEGLMKESESRLEDAQKKLSKLSEEKLRGLLAYEELLLFEKQRCEIFLRGGSSSKASYIKLFSPLKDVSNVSSVIEGASNGLCYLDVDDDPADAPTLLSNPPLFRDFEVLTKLFSPPKYNQIDPTMLLAPGFVVFFGLMLTDAVYGVGLMLSAYLIKRKYGGFSKGLREMTTIISLCGVSAIFFGLLTGSILGDLLGKYVLGGVGSQTVALWLDPLYESNAITFLVFVCALGLIHLYVGFFFGALDELRRGNRRKALTHYFSWYLLLFGGVLIALNWGTLGAASAVAGILLLFSAYGLMVFIDLIGLVGNTLSYARLLAMGLTTAGIAMTFNFLASMALDIPYVGIVVAAAVFIAGHVINILINTLGAFVHSLRLNYVEFFGAFYEGGGFEYTPFVEKRRITEVLK